jgi:AcrR family transcriptional regulator
MTTMRQPTVAAVPSRRRPRPKPRRTNAERTATARRKLIDASLKVLCEVGYAATTTDLVARRANVSRGAMLHHFRTRVDLMAAVAQHVVEEQSRLRRERVESFDAGPQRFFEAGDISWEIQRQPTTTALLEIMLATRSDRALKKRLAPMVQQLSQMRNDAAARMMQNLSIDDRDLMVDLIRVHLATLRGLAVELMFSQTPAEIERARRLLTQYEHTLVRQLMSDQQAAHARTGKHNGGTPPLESPLQGTTAEPA